MYSAEVELVDVATVHCKNTTTVVGTGIMVFSTASGASQLVATRCEMSNNGNTGLHIYNSNSNISHNVCLKNCISHHNSRRGIFVHGKAVVNIHGDITAIHSNGHGISAGFSGKVLIHLPSHHNTIYNNIKGDRRARNGATITNVEDEEEDN